MIGAVGGDSRLTITPFSLEMHTYLFDLCGKLTKKGAETLTTS